MVLIEKVRYEQMSACADALSLLEGLKTKWTIEGETPFYAKGTALVATAVRGGNAQAALKSTPINALEAIKADQITCKAKAV